MGSVANFAALLDRATGEYFMWAADDDVWAPTFVERLLGEFGANPTSSAAMSAVQHVRPCGEICDIVRYSGSADPSTMSPFRVALAQAAGTNYFQYIYGLYRTEFLRQAFPGTPQVACSDALFTIRGALATPLRYVDEILITPSSVTSRGMRSTPMTRWLGASPAPTHTCSPSGNRSPTCSDLRPSLASDALCSSS